MVLAIAAAPRLLSCGQARSERHVESRATARRPVTAAAGRAADAASCAEPAAPPAMGRRQVLGTAAAATLAGLAGGSGIVASSGVAAPPAAEALELAPLGRVERVGGDKLVGLSPEEVKASPAGAYAGGGTHSHACLLLGARLWWRGPAGGLPPAACCCRPAVSACRRGPPLPLFPAGHPGAQPQGGAVLCDGRPHTRDLCR